MLDSICTVSRDATVTMQRRRFLSQAMKTALGTQASLLMGGLPAVSAWAADKATALPGNGLETLAVMVRGLLPHDFLTSDDYVRFAERIDARLGRDAGLQTLVANGLARMNAISGGNWLDASATDQIKALEALQDDPYFGQLLNAAIDALYQDPGVYQRLGYEGSAIEFGGYVNRGFNDIAWLPTDADKD